MNQHPRRNGSPRLAPFFRSLEYVERNHHPYAHMLREDITNGIVPLGGQSRSYPNFAVEISGSDKDIAAAEALIASFSDRNTRSLKESFCRAIEEISRSLSWEASSIYEIVDEDGLSSIHHIAPERTFRLPFITAQIIPPKERSKWKRKFLYCENRRVWTVSIPASLGGPTGFKKMMNRLQKIPLGSMPSFVSADLEKNLHESFDFGTYNKKQILYITRATADWNWHRRDWSDETQCEYYRTYKRAMFRYSQLILRDHLISELNGLLRKISLNCTIKLIGLPSAVDLLSSIDDLREGKIQFNEVYKLIFS